MIAHEDDAFREAISRSVTGIVFLGTPHRGNIGADLANVIGKMLSAAMGLMVKPGDLKLLAHNSEPLRDLALSARHRLHNLALVSFYETRPIPPLNFLVCGSYIFWPVPAAMGHWETRPTSFSALRASYARIRTAVTLGAELIGKLAARLSIKTRLC